MESHVRVCFTFLNVIHSVSNLITIPETKKKCEPENDFVGRQPEKWNDVAKVSFRRVVSSKFPMCHKVGL